jgi:hypothetical protein
MTVATHRFEEVLLIGDYGEAKHEKDIGPEIGNAMLNVKVAPVIMDTTRMSTDTDKVTPSSVSAERSLCARNAARASNAGSRNTLLSRLS